MEKIWNAILDWSKWLITSAIYLPMACVTIIVIALTLKILWRLFEFGWNIL